ncbi:Ig-like domain-containing protein [Aliivibrio sifiae]|nr:Ig-like domain-containing protein [Aliivibrio sifiae]
MDRSIIFFMTFLKLLKNKEMLMGHKLFPKYCLIIIVSGVLFACNFGNENDFKQSSRLVVFVGDEKNLQSAIKYSNGCTLDMTNKVQWHSSDPVYGSVDKGVLRAQRIGSTAITAHFDGMESENNIVFKVVDVKLQSIRLIPSSSTTSLDNTIRLMAMGKYTNNTNAKLFDISWVSSNPEVATVSNIGLVTPVAAGEATITVTVKNKIGVSKITVTDEKLDSSRVPLLGLLW